MRGYKTIYLVAALCLGFAAAFRSATYLILGKFIDALIAKELASYYIPLIAISFFLLAALQGVYTSVSKRVAAKTW